MRCQVRLAGELLKTRFSKPLSFADNGVTVLDPAVGTGTYPLTVIEHAAAAVRGLYGPGAVPQRLAALADRLYAFELLVGPYSVAHLRIAQRLRENGVVGHTPRVYLTDTLESPNQLPEFTATMMQEQISLERKLAQEVKREVPVVVCLGNPPYDREQRDPDSDEGRRKGGWVRYGDDGDSTPPILEDFLAPARTTGAGVHLKNLYNDYVYFWRWALWKVFDSTDDPGIVTFITASSYLQGPGFVGMRRKMREVFDELWIIDLEGDSLGARKTDNVFAIRTPVAIAIGIRCGSPSPDTPAKVHKVKLTGSEREKLETLDSVESFDDLKWRDCSHDWDAPFYPVGIGAYFDWPAVTDVFPWQQSGVKAGRTWPINPERRSLERRWRKLVSADPNRRQVLFVDRPTGRKATDSPPALLPGTEKPPSVWQLSSTEVVPYVFRYSYRSFDRQYVFADARLIDRPGPPIWAAHGDKQVYITSLLTAVMGQGPAAVAASHIPDLHYFCGRGAKDIIPLWRDAEATEPNVTTGLLEDISAVHGATITAERLFAYAYGILAQPEYVRRFWDELELPPPRLPITRDSDLFARVADHGERLLQLHTYRSVPQGEARCTKPVSLDDYPAGFHYDSGTKTLRVGDGEFAPVDPAVWSYSVSGLQVVKSWLNYRKLVPSGRKSSDLDKIRPDSWTFGEELVELLWLLEATLALEPEGAALLDEVCASPLFSADDLPTPTNEERKPPSAAPREGEQLGMASEDTS